MAAIKDSEEAKAGLCASCRHVQRNRSDRGAVFYYCRKSETDPRFPKYPPLPVLSCPGYAPAEQIP
ncbi:MAG: hypothetical protein JO332_04800 [Planctomycetaceae bacterium]|nr:hypothetical protein [Planctomycetaceae bacterium]